MLALLYVFNLERTLSLCSSSQNVADIVQQISVRVKILQYIFWFQYFKVALAMVGSTCGKTHVMYALLMKCMLLLLPLGRDIDSTIKL